MNNQIKKFLSIGFAGVLASVSAINVFATQCVRCGNEAQEGKNYCFECEPISPCEGLHGTPYEDINCDCPHGNQISMREINESEGRCPDCKFKYDYMCHRCKEHQQEETNAKYGHLCSGCSSKLCPTCNRRFKSKADDAECKHCAEFTKELKEKKMETKK